MLQREKKQKNKTIKKMDNSTRLLEDYYYYVGFDSQKARSIIEMLNYGEDAYLLSCIALTYKDESMFYKNGNRRKNIKLETLKVAKNYIDKASGINPNCRDILFTKGEIYNACGDTFTAIDCYIKILELEEDMDTNINCSNSDLKYVQMLLNDARFQLYRLFHDLNNINLSNKFLKEYKKYLKKGVNTIYTPLENFLM